MTPETSTANPQRPTALPQATGSVSFVDVTDDNNREQGGERWLRRIDPKCWISALHRRTGFGWMEWETAIVFIIEPGSRPKRWESDDRDCLIIGGDWREELATTPKEELREWYAANIDGNRNSMETVMHALTPNAKTQRPGIAEATTATAADRPGSLE
jgi:hypothetical protein